MKSYWILSRPGSKCKVRNLEVLSIKSIRRKTSRFCTVFLFVAIIFLQPIIDVCADVSVQDKEVLEAVDKVAPTLEEIAKKLWDLSELSLLKPSR